MPELPEVECVVRGLGPCILSNELVDIRYLGKERIIEGSLPFLDALGYTPVEVFRRGKGIFVALECAGKPRLLLGLHLGMSGSLHAANFESLSMEEAVAKAPVHVRLLFLFRKAGGGVCLVSFKDVRTFGWVWLQTESQVHKGSFWKRVAPDPFALGPMEFASRIGGMRPIKSVLLDQHVVSGIGNIYATESLFAAKIHPLEPADTLSLEARKSLHRELLRLLSFSVECGGSSIRDYVGVDGSKGSFQEHFKVYGKAGLPCPDCGLELCDLRIDGRQSVFCPSCQKLSERKR